MARYGKMQRGMMRVLAVMTIVAFVLAVIASVTASAAPRKEYECGI
ncbi:MAG: hypothetical protein N2508_16895 [Anaerolineae bacterium]|nr:hypothetical protein [Anaerolineae bacterium]